MGTLKLLKKRPVTAPPKTNLGDYVGVFYIKMHFLAMFKLPKGCFLQDF
jgi:hypothetical protein